MNLRPRADSATGASVTAYTFSRPTPVANWTFVLGDIDADAVTIRAVGPDGAVLPASALGFRGGFNYCAPGLAGKPSCTGSALDVPTWDPATSTLTGNPAAVDTSGAAAWFEPSQPISSLTFAFARRSGFPVYQTWFATLARDIAGTVADVTDPGAPTTPAGVLLRLIDETGAVIGTTMTDAAGAYVFEGITATGGYTVEVVPPAGQTIEGPRRVPVNLTDTDGIADFTIRDIVPVPVSGTVRDADGNPLGGVEVVLTGGSTPLTTVTAIDGTYLFDTVPPGTYTPTASPPPGYSGTTALPPITVPVGDETPITDQDFVFAANPTLSGRVSDGSQGVAGVTVTAVGPSGTLTTVTDDDGAYAFPLLPSGDYEVSIAVPDGYTSDAPSQSVTLTADDEVADFAVEAAPRTGVIAGTVTDDGDAPVAGATIAIDVDGPPLTVTTGDDGSYSIDGLPAGAHTVTVTAPDGYEIVGSGTQTATLTDAGETVDVSFELAVVDGPTPTPTPTETTSPSPTPTPTETGGTGPSVGLPVTGGGDLTPVAVWGAALVAVGILIARGSRVRSRR